MKPKEGGVDMGKFTGPLGGTLAAATMVGVVFWLASSGPTQAMFVADLQLRSVCDDLGANCTSTSFDVAFVQSIYDQADLVLNVFPETTFNSTAFRTINSIEEMFALWGGGDPNVDDAANPALLNMWFTEADPALGFVGNALVGRNKSWFESGLPTTAGRFVVARQLGANFGLAGDSTDPANVMCIIAICSIFLPEFGQLTPGQIAIIQSSEFTAVVPVTAVPLPAAWAMFLPALTGLWLMLKGRRRHRRLAPAAS